MNKDLHWRMSMTCKLGAALLCFALGCAVITSAWAANCDQTSVNRVPINDLGSGLYLGQYPGGLYPNGSNIPPASHAIPGLARANAVEPLNFAGEPDAKNGKHVLLSIGMSNTTQEFSRFIQIAATHPLVNHETLAIVDGAAGGQSAATWDSPNDFNYNRVRDEVLAPLGLSEAQVQAIWLKVANPGPNSSLPNANADANTLVQQMGHIARAIKVRYPNIKVVFASSRIYAGYASSTLNPEPYAYESGFAVKWLIQAQINQLTGGGINPLAGDLNYEGPAAAAPWIAWGPYLWADGLIPRSDGLIWQCSDLAADGTHPSNSGRQKVATMLLQFMLTSPYARPWFRNALAGDVNDDLIVNVDDLLLVLQAWGPCPNCELIACPADINGNCIVNVDDLLLVLASWTF